MVSFVSQNKGRYIVEEVEDKSKRVNLRVPLKQYERMMEYGAVLGLDSDSAVLKHFINLGLQFGGAALAAQISSDTNAKMLKVFETFAEDCKAEQTDLVEQAAKAGKKRSK